jgi:Na+-driven multidrug efflux pump
MILLRRFLALIALFFWQGGFTFYASVVVPIGQQVFGPLRQGFLTRQVTVYLNLAGALALLVLVWDLLATREPSKWRQRSRWLLWIGMMLSLLWLIRLHGQLDEHLVAKGYIIRDADVFRWGHRLYLWISSVQWAWGLLYLVATLAMWRKEDRIGRDAEEMQGAKKVPPLATSASPSHRSSHTAEQES